MKPVRWYTQSIHAAIEAHQTIRRRRAMHAQLEAIYGPTIHYGPPEPLPIGLATELRRAAESRNRIASEARRLRDARNAYRFQRLLLAQHGLCYLCAEPFSEDRPPTKDHVWPKSRGGKNVRNILWACMSCNNGKGDDPPTEAMMVKLREINDALDQEPIPVRTPKTFVGRAFRVV